MILLLFRRRRRRRHHRHRGGEGGGGGHHCRFQVDDALLGWMKSVVKNLVAPVGVVKLANVTGHTEICKYDRMQMLTVC